MFVMALVLYSTHNEGVQSKGKQKYMYTRFYKSRFKEKKEEDLLEERVGVLNIIAVIFIILIYIWMIIKILSTLTPPQI